MGESFLLTHFPTVTTPSNARLLCGEGGGVLSFTECCEELGYSPAPARHTLLAIANGKP